MTRAQRILSLAESILSEVRANRTISYRGGKRQRRVSCPPGYKLVRPRGSSPGTMGQCRRQGAVERRRRSMGSKRRARKVRGRAAVVQRKRAKSLRRRRAAGLY